jgi:hypothetical protein
MKRISAISLIFGAHLAACLCSLGAWDDPFDYPEQSTLVGRTNSAGLTWVAAGSGAEQPTIVPGSLVVPGLSAPKGNRARVLAGAGHQRPAALPWRHQQ